MKITIVDRNQPTAAVFEEQFADVADVKVVCCSFEQLADFDCIVTAGNSFGLMDAGMDLAVVRYFGSIVMERIQKVILDEFLGEQPVGTSFLVPTDHALHPFVAHAPTMRIPMNINGTDNIYLACWSTLVAIHRHNANRARKINSVAFPGLGTGTGGVHPKEASLQMRLAIEHYQSPPKYLNGTVAQRRHERVHFGGKWGFEHPRPTGKCI